MVTPEEIGEVQILGALSPDERERVSRSTADIHLVAGEFAVNEGDERALYAVLDGHIEVVRIIDGIERVIGQPTPATCSERFRSRSATASRARIEPSNRRG